VHALTIPSFWGVFWVDVDSQSTAKKGFLSIAKALEYAAESVEEALQALANTKKPWLLILDNADNPSFDYTQYIPSGVKGAVVMTSRIPHCSKYSTIPAEALEGLDVGHSTQLLLKAAQVPEESWQSCEEQAQAILHLLGSHTLALIQAGAYIAEGYCRLDQYPELYQRQRKRLLKHYPEQEQSRYRDVYATFEASVDVLKSSNTEVGQDALDILGIMAMLQSSDLPIQVFADAWRGARDVLETEHAQIDDMGDLTQRHVSQLPEFFNMQTDEWDDYRLKKALALLASLSLVTRHSLHDLDGLSMHPLAHAWAKDRLGQEQQQMVWVNVGCLLALSRGDADTWQGYERQLWPHVQSFLSPSVDTILSYGPLEMILPILLKCGWVLDVMREDDALEFLLNDIYRVLQIAPSNPSQEHTQIWDLAARSLANSGYARRAVVLLEYIVKVQESTLVETHPTRLDSQHELARVYIQNGQTNEAVALLEHVVKVRDSTLKETHPARLASQHVLANAYNNNGQTNKAVALLEHVVEVEETTLIETHPDRLASQHVLANAYIDIRKMEEAVALLEHVVKVRESTLKETHPHRLASQHMLASAYNINGQTNEAVALLEHVVKVEETTLTETHPDRLASQQALAIAYNSNGQTKEAVALLKHIVKIEETTLAATHPSRQVSVLELTRMQRRIEQLTI
jgi:tetratricopeptide (TPR) repeat protein